MVKGLPAFGKPPQNLYKDLSYALLLQSISIFHSIPIRPPISHHPFIHQLSPKPGAGIRAKSCAEVIFLFKHYCILSSQSSSVSTVRTNRAINYNIRIHYVNKGSLDIVTSSVHRSNPYFLHPILKPLIKSN